MTGVWLLDVNVLLGWIWPSHQVHLAASSFMKKAIHEGWATSPITEMGFLRIVTNPSFSPHAPKWKEAVSLLRQHTMQTPGHHFWPDSLSSQDIDRQFGSQIQGSGQITDAYLLAQAMQNGGRMVTFDYRMSALVQAGSGEEKSLLILHP